jgi:hypothetical protein
MSGLERISKTGAYRFRRGIPAHLRPYFPDRGTVWREHLDTKVEREARVRCLDVAARVERLFQQAQAQFDAERDGTPADTSNLSLEYLTALALYQHELVDRARAAMIISNGSKRLTVESLRTHPDRYPGFWNLSGTASGGIVLYRLDWLEKYKAARDARPSTTPLGIGWGRQEIPETIGLNWAAEAWVHWRSEDGQVRGHSSREWTKSPFR